MLYTLHTFISLSPSDTNSGGSGGSGLGGFLSGLLQFYEDLYKNVNTKAKPELAQWLLKEIASLKQAISVVSNPMFDLWAAEANKTPMPLEKNTNVLYDKWAADALKNMGVIDVTDDYKYLVAGPLGTEGTMGKQMEAINATVLPKGNNSGTFTIGVGGNITLLVGASVSIQLSFDKQGNIVVQWSYSYPSDETKYVGFADIGLAGFVSVTDAETVYELEKATTQLGVSGGALGYGGIDLITFGQPTDNGDINGAQISLGVGAGMDIHIVSPATETIIKVR